MKEVVEAISVVMVVVVVVVVMSGWARSLHDNKMEPQRQDSHHQVVAYPSNRYLPVRMLMHTFALI